MVDTAARLAAHLADLPGGVGCRHLARQRDDVDTGLLVDLGLVRPIISRVPRCRDHGCPLLHDCPHAADFEPDASGNKAGVKYKATAEGLAAATDPDIIGGAVVSLPAAAEVLVGLTSGPATAFALHARFVERARDAAARGERMDVPGASRVTFGATLVLLTEVGLVRLMADGVTYEGCGSRS